jgi:hypothetical protein
MEMSNEKQAPVAQGWEGAEEWMPLAWHLCAEENGEDACTELVWEGGPVPEPWGDRWLKYEDKAKRMIAKVREQAHAAPAPMAQPADPMTLLTDADVFAAAEGWREFDAPDDANLVARMIYGGCRAAMNAYRDALTRAAPAPVALTPAQQHADELLAVLKRVNEFIRNGIALGFIRMPDQNTPDTAHEVPEAVRAVLAKVKATGQEGGE